LFDYRLCTLLITRCWFIRSGCFILTSRACRWLRFTLFAFSRSLVTVCATTRLLATLRLRFWRLRRLRHAPFPLHRCYPHRFPYALRNGCLLVPALFSLTVRLPRLLPYQFFIDCTSAARLPYGLRLRSRVRALHTRAPLLRLPTAVSTLLTFFDYGYSTTYATPSG